jgi:hypothetical protein
MKLAPAVAAAALVALTACGGKATDRAVLLSGRERLGRPPQPVTDAQATREASAARRDWLGSLRAGAAADPGERFRSPPLSRFVARLEHAALAYHLTVEAVTAHRPRQLAPEATLESDDFVRAAHALGPILDLVDPALPPRANHRAYEGILLRLVDDRGIPYASAFDSLRGNVEGGQWARAERLYPFAHG